MHQNILLCLLCGQKWKKIESTPTFRYVKELKHWSLVIEEEAKELCSDSKVKFEVIWEEVKEGTMMRVGPKLDYSTDASSLGCIIRAIRKHLRAMPLLERNTFSSIADALEESGKQG